MSGQRRIVIYTSELTNRVRYIFDFVFKRCLQVDYLLFSNDNEIHENDFVIEYSNNRHSKFPFIKSEGLLREQFMLRKYLPVVGAEGEEMVLFPVADKDAILPFDVFSAVFYCLSAYPAYLVQERDQHGRIDFRYWFLRENGMDQYPMVEIWIDRLAARLTELGFSVKRKSAACERFTFDIDHCFAYRERSFKGHLKGFSGDIIKGRWQMLYQRLSVLFRGKDDPYTDFMHIIDKYPNKDFHSFILMREGLPDSLNVNGRAKIHLLKKLSERCTIGLHPSYESPGFPERIAEEKSLLHNYIRKEVLSSRQHYLRYEFPETFRKLAAAGIKEDYSLGYYDQPGLMLGTALKFPFYDLFSEEQLKLEMIPFVWMDSMNRYYRTLSAEKERAELMQWRERLLRQESPFICVFHNDTLSEKRFSGLLHSLLEC